MKNLIYLFLIIIPFVSNSQEKKKAILNVSGFVSAETFFDTRKSVNSRQGDVLLYPAEKVYDDYDNDINDKSSLFMSSIHSRLSLKLSEFSAFGAKAMACIEGDFAGTTTANTGLFRLRHAYIKLNWGKDQILAGKYWHPMFVTQCYPPVLHWGGGIPYNVLSRAPQVRYTRSIGTNSHFLIAALSQQDFTSPGIDGNNSKYAQNSSIPEFTSQLRIRVNKNIEVGTTIGIKFIKPALSTVLTNGKTLESDEILSSHHLNAWVKYKSDNIVWSNQFIYGENMNNFVMIGGYGVKNIKENGELEYTNIKTSAFWSDLQTMKGSVRYGINFGYTKNLGANDNLVMKDGKVAILYSRGANIDYLYQIAPRVEFHSGDMMFGLQAIYSAAAYGTTQASGKVTDTYQVANNRFLMHLKYSF